MNRVKVSFGGLLALMLATGWGCSPKIYKPPALGAEYQVDRGYPPEKHPKSLFGKKMTKDLTDEGILRSGNASSPKQASSKKTANNAAAKADSAQINTRVQADSAKAPPLPAADTANAPLPEKKDS